MMELNSGITTITGNETNPEFRIENDGIIVSWESKGRPPITSRVINKLKGITNLQIPTIINAVRNIPAIDNAVVVGGGIEHLSVDKGMVIVPVPYGMVAMVAIIRDAMFANRIRMALYSGSEGFTREAFEGFVDSLKDDDPININFGIYGDLVNDGKKVEEPFPWGPEFYRESIHKRLSSLSKSKATNVADQLGRKNGRRSAGYCVVASTSDFEGLDFISVRNK